MAYRPTDIQTNQPFKQPINKPRGFIGNLHFPYSKLPFRLFKPTWSSIPEYTAAKNADFEEKFFVLIAASEVKEREKGDYPINRRQNKTKKETEK